jgi:para-aminobenzoate synthetase/4-amino-4-deoxychorismate lyase
MYSPCVLIHDNGKWLLFEKPLSVIETCETHLVIDCLDELQRNLNLGYYGAGFLTYESASAFEPEIPVYSSRQPKLWFAIFKNPKEIILSEKPDFHLPSFDWTPQISEENYHRNISLIKEYIARGDTYQVNYSFDLKSEFKGNPFDYFRHVVLHHPSPYAAFVDTGSYSFCSFSPELFFSLNDHLIICKPMKGTASRGIISAEDDLMASQLFNSDKNRAENVMIVDMIRNDLGRISRTGSVKVSRLFEIEKYETVFQMTSTVEARTDHSIPQIFQSLFPCASITGAPKIRTAQIIHELEKRPRGIYCGTIGYASPHKKALFNVAIRTAVIDNSSSSITYSIGSGIVWDSHSRNEFHECLSKAKVIQNGYSDFQIIESLLYTKEEGYFLQDSHVKRCMNSCRYFGFKVVESSLIQILTKLKETLPDYPVKVRCVVYKNGHIESSITPVISAEEPIPVTIADSPVNSNDICLYHKTTRRQFYQGALRSSSGGADVIFWNENGYLTETTSANLVLLKNGRYLTPDVSCGLLAGTFRNHLLENKIIEEAKLKIEDLFDCEKIFRINSVRRWQRCYLVNTNCHQL